LAKDRPSGVHPAATRTNNLGRYRRRRGRWRRDHVGRIRAVERRATVRAEATAGGIARPTASAASFRSARGEVEGRRCGALRGRFAARGRRLRVLRRGRRGCRNVRGREAPRRSRGDTCSLARNQAVATVLTEPERVRVRFAAAATPHHVAQFVLASPLLQTGQVGPVTSAPGDRGARR
jgi:hypothetical protein